MQLGFHFGFKKSKAYGLCGVMLAILFLGMFSQSAKAEEVTRLTEVSTMLKADNTDPITNNSEVGIDNISKSQTDFQTQKLSDSMKIEQKNSSDIAVLTNSFESTSSSQEPDDAEVFDQYQSQKNFLDAIKQGAID